jgi:hypothetical protein
MSERGRRRERPAQGYLSPAEAAEILDVVPGTIKNMIKRGDLEGGQYLTKANEPRWEVSEESVKAFAEATGRPANIAQIERAFKVQSAEAVLQVIQSLTNTVQVQGDAQVREIQTNRKTFLAAAQEVLGAIAEQRKQVTGAVKNQESAVARRLDAMAKLVQEMAHTEQEHQAETLRIQRETLVQQRRVAELLERVEHTERQRNEHYQQERRGFFRRVFGT